MLTSKSQVVVASPLEIATACRSLIIQQAENRLAAKGLPVPHFNGQLNGWFPIGEVVKLLPCCICNMEPVVNDNLACTLNDGMVSAAHTKCLRRDEIPDRRDAMQVAARLHKLYPYMFEAGRRLLNGVPRLSTTPSTTQTKHKPLKKKQRVGRRQRFYSHR